MLLRAALLIGASVFSTFGGGLFLAPSPSVGQIYWHQQTNFSVVARIMVFRHLRGKGKMILLLSLNITMNEVGGASVIAKFQS